MGRVGRIVGLVLLCLVGSMALFLLGVNLYVQSKSTQATIQQELSQRVGLPLHIQRISVTPWSGLKLSGITVADGTPAGKSFLNAKNFRLRVKLFSLFRRPLIVKEVALIHPVVVWPQDENGKWHLPSHPPLLNEPQIANDQSPAPAKASAPLREPASPPSPRPHFAVAQPEIRRVKLVDGSFHFLDHDGNNVALFDEVQFRSSVRNGIALSGDVSVGQASLRDRVFLTRLRSPVRYDGTRVELPKLSVVLAKGELAGSFSIAPEEADAPFETHSHFSKIDADELVTRAGGPPGMVRGLLEGTLDASGKIPDAITGAGTIALRDGHVQQVGALAVIGQLLQIPELSQLDLTQAEAHYHLEPGRILVDDLLLQSSNLRLHCTGTITLEGNLKLEATLTINEKIRGQLFRGVRENFIATDEPGLYALPFHITGTMSKPKTDLMQRVIGPELRDLGSMLDSFLGRGKKKREKPTPSPSP
ncbi:MAG: type II secretion system protein GspN [Verrucomicrobiota bacterium]|nr:type II secretion system protein GspN [Verrucomicrobiota bacterium]